MLYIGDEEVRRIGFDWNDNIEVIEKSVRCLASGDYVQPVKPYLRYGNPKNRIIAMPAFLGGEINISGLKWIASFPDNYQRNLPRAHCVVILNNADTGEPVAILNSPSISAIRTAAVSGFVIKKYLTQKQNRIVLGIIGFGPIGQHHLNMCLALLGGQCLKVILYDIKELNIDGLKEQFAVHIERAERWEDVYFHSDIFITCTVSNERYIDKKPKPGSLHLNVSLRDYKIDVYPWFKNAIMVDDWLEICRENTDIEALHLGKGLIESDVSTIKDLLDENWMSSVGNEQAIMFNPMGMAIFDIAIAQRYVQRICDAKILSDSINTNHSELSQ